MQDLTTTLRAQGLVPTMRRVLSSDRSAAIALATGAFIAYMRTLAPGLLDGDSGEWQYMTNILGVAHSTGYPLYLLLVKLFTVIPMGTPAWRVNLFSAVCAALTVGVIYFLALRLCRSRVAAAVAAALFAVAPTLWASAVEAEVYALNSLLLSLTLFFALRWHQEDRPRYLYLMSLSFGLALDNHRVSIFFAPGLLVLVLFHLRSLNLRRVMASALVLLIPLLLYVYIPLRASQLLAQQSAANWDLYPRAEAYLRGTVSAYYNHTPYGFFNLVTGFDNRNKLGFEGSAGGDSLLDRATSSVLLLNQQFNPLALLLSVAGLFVLWRRDWRLAVVLCLITAGVTAISLTLRAESTRFYFSAAYMVVGTFFALGVSALLDRLRGRRLQVASVTALLALFPLAALAVNYAAIDQSGNTSYEYWARQVIADNLAPNAVVVAPWEIVTPLRYLQLVEGRRADVLFVHESPIRPQYQKMLEGAHRQQRPFYYVLFDPEDKRASGPRTVQAVGLPLLTRPSPAFALDKPLVDGVRVLGFDVTAGSGDSDKFARLAVYYQVIGDVHAQYRATIDWGDIRGEPQGSLEHMPVTGYYPTYFWKAGEYYRDVWELPLAAEQPAGLYSADLSWVPFDPTTNSVDTARARTLPLGPFPIGDLNAGDIPIAQKAEFENGMTLLGFGLSNAAGTQDSATVARGSTLRVSLYWEASRQIDKAYTMFVHLVDKGGVVRAQSDHPPLNGLYPTDRWVVGKPVKDAFDIQVPSDLAPGDYSLETGLYATAPVHVAAGGDRVQLDVKVQVR